MLPETHAGNPRRDEAAIRVAAKQDCCLNVQQPGEPGANTSPSPGGHARVTSPRRSPSTCGAFVPAVIRPCPRFPPPSENGKEGVDGSSPSEGF